MKRGQLFFNKYKDTKYQDRRIPVLIVSPDEYNDSSDFVTCVRTVKFVAGPKRETHVFIPRTAFQGIAELCDCYALADTVGSVRKTNLGGPIGVLLDESYMDKVCKAIEMQIGVEPMRWIDARTEPVSMVNVERPTQTQPWFSAEIERIQKAERAAAENAGG